MGLLGRAPLPFSKESLRKRALSFLLLLWREETKGVGARRSFSRDNYTFLLWLLLSERQSSFRYYVETLGVVLEVSGRGEESLDEVSEEKGSFPGKSEPKGRFLEKIKESLSFIGNSVQRGSTDPFDRIKNSDLQTETSVLLLK